MRAFVAVEIPDVAVLDAIVKFQSEAAATGAGLKLVGRENLHYTIRFFGEISERQAAEVDSRLASLRPKAVDVEVSGAGAFPSASRPSVVWVGVAREDEQAMFPIAKEVRDATAGIGQDEDRPFKPHLTVGRVRNGKGIDRLGEFLSLNSERTFGKVKLSALKLKSSVLTPSGPVYSDVGVYPLT